MLPLKAGVCIMGLGAMNAYHIPVKIVPCGLNYYRVRNYLVQGHQPKALPKLYRDMNSEAKLL